jgi:FKBP-type peptidyl-prolyl cis-trans isomerase FklB
MRNKKYKNTQMKRYILLLAAVAISTYSSAQTKPATAPLLKTQLDSASYAFGASIANDLKNRGINNLNYTLVSKAMSDVFSGGNVVFSPEKCQEVIYGLLNLL